MGYDAFISYSHESDLDLARVTRDGLQKLAKPWNRRRALDIFLDQSSLELSSELGSSLDDRIEDTEWLVLFMSETSAGSKWVGAEIADQFRNLGITLDADRFFFTLDKSKLYGTGTAP